MSNCQLINLWSVSLRCVQVFVISKHCKVKLLLVVCLAPYLRCFECCHIHLQGEHTASLSQLFKTCTHFTCIPVSSMRLLQAIFLFLFFFCVVARRIILKTLNTECKLAHECHTRHDSLHSVTYCHMAPRDTPAVPLHKQRPAARSNLLACVCAYAGQPLYIGGRCSTTGQPF